MSNIVNGSPSISDLAEDEVDLIAGGTLEGRSTATYTKTCKVDANGNGWCFLKED